MHPVQTSREQQEQCCVLLLSVGRVVWWQRDEQPTTSTSNNNYTAWDATCLVSVSPVLPQTKNAQGPTTIPLGTPMNI